jgi:hypothetical protein
MAKGSDRLGGGFGIDEGAGTFSGLLADEEELDRRALFRLGTWAAVSIGAVIVALITNQSSIGARREQTAAADLLKQTQQVQLAARETQSEARRLASAIDTLNGDRDRLYSRVAVLEQGLDSVTGAIARQNSSPPAAPSQASASPAVTSPAAPSPTAANSASTSPASASPGSTSVASASPGFNTPVAPAGPSAASSASASQATSVSATPAVAASVDPPPAVPKPSPAPVVAPVAATTAAVTAKQAPAVTESSPAVASLSAPKPAAQSSGTLMDSKSMMAPPDPAAGKLIEAAVPPKTVTSAPMPDVVPVAPAPAEDPVLASAAPELVVKRTEFGVDVGGANSISGLRALWRGLLKSRSNAALTSLRPIIVIKENSNGFGMQLRLVAGPISDAAAAAKICASLTVNDRSCTTAVFEGQRLAMNADEQAKAEIGKADIDKTGTNSVENSKPAAVAPKSSSHRRSSAWHPSEDAPKTEPSTLSLLFGRR